jgi:hypothetical protein
MNQRIDGLVHLPSRCPVDLDAPLVSFFGKHAEKIGEARVQ